MVEDSGSRLHTPPLATSPTSAIRTALLTISRIRAALASRRPLPTSGIIRLLKRLDLQVLLDLRRFICRNGVMARMNGASNIWALHRARKVRTSMTPAYILAICPISICSRAALITLGR